MQIAKQIPVYLLAFIFVAGGAAFFLKMMPEQPMTGNAAKFMELFGPTGYMTFIKACEIIFGLMLILPKTRALGLILLAPIVVNILAFEVFVANQLGIGVALVALIALAIYFNKEKYQSIMA